MPGQLSPSERLRLAGLDPELPASRGALAADGTAARYCPYTGRELLMVRGDETVRLGEESFSSAGGLVRYSPAGGGELVTNPTGLAEWRGSLDLRLSSGTPLPTLALRQDAPAGEVAESLPLVASGMGTVTSVGVRHGRLYALLSYRGRQHGLQSWTVPDAKAPAGWRHQRVSGEVIPRQPGRPGTELRVSETLVYINFDDGLGAWHAGTGEHRVQWPWPAGNGLPQVRIADDRMLLLRPADDGHTVAVYDLAEVAGGPCQPLSGQAMQLPGPLTGQAQPVWAERASDRFAVLSSDGRVVVFPFDGAPFEAFANTEDVRLGPPSIRATDSGPELLAYVGIEAERWLLVVPLSSGEPYRFEPMRAADLASQGHAPCFLDGRLLEVSAATDENVVVNRTAAGSLTVVDERVELPSSAGSRLYDLQTIVCGGRELVVASWGRTTRRPWVADAALEQVDVMPPFPALRIQDDIRLYWDAAGLYLCNLTAGQVHLRRPV